MLPIAVLPVAGLLMGLGSSFTNETTLATYNLLGIMGPGTIAWDVFTVLSACGGVIFDNLPLIFAIGVAIGMARAEKEVAALSAGVAFLVMHSAISAMIDLTGGVEQFMDGATASVLGITSLQMGAFGGIIVGLGTSALHNRFYKIQLPQALSFFGGSRFVPIISTVVFTFVGIAMFFVWQPVQTGINALGYAVASAGPVGVFLFGMIKRLLIPFGLRGATEEGFSTVLGPLFCDCVEGTGDGMSFADLGRAPEDNPNPYLRAYQEDFAARAAWCAHEPAACNHAPVIEGVTPDMAAAPGETVEVGAWVSDPDGDMLTCRWAVDTLSSTYSGAHNLASWRAEGASAHFTVPADAAPGDRIPLTLRVQDAAKRPCTRYAQVAVTVAVEVPSAQGRTAARCYVDDDESQFGQ